MRRIAPPCWAAAHSRRSGDASRRRASVASAIAAVATAPITGRWPSSGAKGIVPVAQTASSSSVAATRSKSTTTDIVEAIVATLEPPMPTRTRATLAASPPRPGTPALRATPTAYALATPSTGTRVDG